MEKAQVTKVKLSDEQLRMLMGTLQSPGYREVMVPFLLERRQAHITTLLNPQTPDPVVKYLAGVVAGIDFMVQGWAFIVRDTVEPDAPAEPEDEAVGSPYDNRGDDTQQDAV